ncbi:hypothetical protein, partial [Plasmodium yoelii yoelii]
DGVLLGVQQEGQHPGFALLHAAPVGIEPGLGEIGSVISTVAEQGVAVHAVLGLHRLLALGNQGRRFILAQRPAEQRFVATEYRAVAVQDVIEAVVDGPVDDAVGLHPAAADRSLRQRVEGQDDEDDERTGSDPDRNLFPKALGSPDRR